MKSRRRRLHVLCEDELHLRFVERLADRWHIGPRQRRVDASPVDAWSPPAPDEAAHVPALTDARRELAERLDV